MSRQKKTICPLHQRVSFFLGLIFFSNYKTKKINIHVLFQINDYNIVIRGRRVFFRILEPPGTYVCHDYRPLNYLTHAARTTPPTLPSSLSPHVRTNALANATPRAERSRAEPRHRMCASLRYLSLPVSLSGSIAARHRCCSKSSSTSITRCRLGRGYDMP